MKRDRRSERGGRSRRVLIEFKKGNAPEKVKKEQLARYLDRLIQRASATTESKGGMAYGVKTDIFPGRQRRHDASAA